MRWGKVTGDEKKVWCPPSSVVMAPHWGLRLRVSAGLSDCQSGLCGMFIIYHYNWFGAQTADSERYLVKKSYNSANNSFLIIILIHRHCTASQPANCKMFSILPSWQCELWWDQIIIQPLKHHSFNFKLHEILTLRADRVQSVWTTFPI